MHEKIKKSFVMIGTGNLAFHLTKALLKLGWKLKQVVGKTKNSTKKFADLYNANYTYDLKAIDSSADVYFFCISDDQIKNLASKLTLNNKLLIHCSGSVQMDVLKNASTNYGVMYPLYTFSAGDIDLKFEPIPFFIEGNSAKALNEIKKLAYKLSKKVKTLNSIQRKKLHLVAVMSSNFINYLLDLTYLYLKKESAGEIKDLMPLIEKTISKLNKHLPDRVQTGPAVRRDFKTINQHLTLLKDYPQHKQLYKLFSKAILQRHYKNRFNEFQRKIK